MSPKQDGRETSTKKTMLSMPYSIHHLVDYSLYAVDYSMFSSVYVNRLRLGAMSELTGSAF